MSHRSLSDGECAYFSTGCPAGTPAATLVAVEGQRWAIEDGFETAKTELGLDHNDTRSKVVPVGTAGTGMPPW